MSNEEIKKNEESVESDMEKKVYYTFEGHPRTDFGGVDHYTIEVTKRQRELIMSGQLNPFKIYDKQESERRKRYEERRKRYDEIINDNAPEMDNWEEVQIKKRLKTTKRIKILHDEGFINDEQAEIETRNYYERLEAKTSTDPEMERIGTVKWGDGSIEKMTKREAMSRNLINVKDISEMFIQKRWKPDVDTKKGKISIGPIKKAIQNLIGKDRD